MTPDGNHTTDIAVLQAQYGHICEKLDQIHHGVGRVRNDVIAVKDSVGENKTQIARLEERVTLTNRIHEAMIVVASAVAAFLGMRS